MTKKASKKTQSGNGTNIQSLNSVFKQLYRPAILGTEFGLTYCGPNSTVKDWLKADYITPEDIIEYPNAKEAAHIKKSKLYKSLK